jgi:hypothetical protein
MRTEREKEREREADLSLRNETEKASKMLAH